MSKNLSMSKQTPTIAISDNRGLSIRALAYNRSEATQAADELISCNRYNAVGQLIASRDARLEIDNFRYQYNLAGAALRTDGVDNGTMLQLTDIEGRPVMSLDAKGTRSWVTYEPTLGRPLEHHQQTEGGQKTVTDRFFYAENNGQHKAANLNGQCIRHYDTAGLQELIRLSITGAPLQQQRRLLAETLGPVDWFGEEHWDSRLSDEYFVTHGTTDALGQPLTQTDAKGHTQQMAYNRAGQLSGSWLTLKGGAKQVMVKSLTYSAAGQKLREESGNGVVTQYRYEAQTQRLIGIKTTRPALKDRPTLLQDLRYDYDPVGNILAIHNDAEATRFYRNQKIVPETTYRYDALYQLIEATGRESDKNSAQSANLPDLVSLTDGNQYVNYTRRYSYDRGGNLLKIQHTGASNYTTHITVSDTCNHGIQQQDGLTAADIRSQFDAAGNQQQLQPGQPLQWDARNQLQQVITVKREAGNSPNNDYESYLYGSDGMRIVKHSIQQRQTSKVVYLPGLELRTQHNNDKLTEDFQVITVGAAGRAQVRVLLWQHGKPDDIANNQLRYSFDNQIGSSLLELDHNGDIISQEEYYPFGGTAVFASRNTVEAKYKTVRYSGKERDATGLYYYGLRYYLPWLGRWLSSDPAGTIDGLNLYRMVRNNPISLMDEDGLAPLFSKNKKDDTDSKIKINFWQKYGRPAGMQRSDIAEYSNSLHVDIAQVKTDIINGVTYLNAESRAKYEVEVSEDGRLKYKYGRKEYVNQDAPNEGSYTLWKQYSKAYVIGKNNRMYVNNHEPGRFHHSSFFSGEKVRDAGMIAIAQGKILYINAKSGHYRPSLEQKLYTADYLHSQKADLNNTLVEPFVENQIARWENRTLHSANEFFLEGARAKSVYYPDNYHSIKERREELEGLTKYKIPQSKTQIMQESTKL
ncbi:RHS repeat protein [Yersinia intermedia]|uniref:RHS repeat domain-containing protein n=1 Tax=Yersinia intermedia TaxID=631 RepID=UPI001CFF3786|nr:RHS repeat domain-containing protein [Yersinia intermedia]MCB5322597.1 RHS repeat protein [Yersinia intermedia]